MDTTHSAPPAERAFTRRGFVAGLAVAGLGMLRVPRPLRALESSRALSFRHLHTGERLQAEYFALGDYLPRALADINHVLRDWRTGDVHAMDPALLDLLYDLHRTTGSRHPFEVICGYRSPATNSMLRQHSTKVSATSLHLKGKAIDIRLADVPLARLRDAAKALRGGGVGYYPDSDFVHVDTGRVRSW
jgi:uncharacterized protein YcbK (DUF882 family)